MTSLALARRPPDSPLLANGRKVTAELQAGGYLRFEPDVVRAHPPPSGRGVPTLPGYLQPRPLVGPLAKPPPAARDAQAGKKDKDGKDKDGKDKDGKDDKAAKGDGKDGAQDGRPAAKAAAPDAARAKDKDKRAARRPKGDDEGADEADDQADDAVVESGPAELEQDAHSVTDPSHAYDGPTELTSRPPTRAGAQKEKLEPDTEAYAALFAEAAAAAKRLHDALIADAQGAADAARNAASEAAEQRQSELDRSLAALDDGLADARSTLASLADDAASLVEQRAAEATLTIRQAAASAKGALAAAQANVIARKAGADAMRWAAEFLAAAYEAAVAAAGSKVAEGLGALKDDPGAYFRYPGEVMGDAINEAVVTRAPKRAEHRIKAFADEAGRQSKTMSDSFGKLPAAFTGAFQTVNAWIERTGAQGRTAVDNASAASLKQLASMRRQMLAAIRKGRTRTDAALVRQHNAARAQTIAAHKTRAKSEALVESRRAEQDITGLRALAISQGSAARVLSDGFAKQTDRGEKAFAKAVATASRGFMQRVAAADGGQRPRLVASAATNRGVTERQSQGAGEGLIRSAGAVAGQIGVAARESGDALFSQANDTSSSYAKLAEPVSKSIQAYLPPVGAAFDTVIHDLEEAVANTLKSVTSYYSGGDANEKEGGPKEGATPATPKPEDPNAPKMLPAKFVEVATEVGAKPKTDTQIADLANQANPEIRKLVDNKAAAVWTHIGAFHVETDAILTALRSTTAMQGAAVKAEFGKDHGDIELFIRMNMPKTFSTYTTNKNNVDAAINYLNGRDTEGALNELKAAVNWSNENARVEAVARSLTPAQWKELKKQHAGDLKDVRDDLGGVNQEIFDALSSEGDAASKALPGLTNDKGIADAGIGADSGKGVAKANALRLRDTLDASLEQRGDKGADKAADDVENAAISAGTDVISGADPVAGLQERKLDAIDLIDWEGQRKAKVWEGSKAAFDQLEADHLKGAKPQDAKAGWTIAAYASKARQYNVYVANDPNGPYAAYGGAGDYEERYGHWETKTESIRSEQTRLVQAIVEHGPDSDEAAAARVIVELSREGGKPKPERLDKAMHASDLDARENENKKQDDPDTKRKKLEAARARQQRVLALVGRIQQPDLMGPVDAEGVRKQITNQVTAAEASDPSAQAMVKRTMRGPADNWDTEQNERLADARVAFDYALAHESERGDTLKRTFGRMDRDEIDAAVGQWNKTHEGQKPLFQQLNLFGQGSWWTEKLSGDERNDVELAAMGVARNRKEQAEVARFRAEQQIRDAGWLGHLAGLVTGDWQRLEESRDKVEELMGLPHDAFDAMGRASKNGHFDEKGNLQAKYADRDADLEVAMNMTHLTAESYKVMTDSLATAVTTALVVVAAVVTTALTGGAAASIWIPVLVTAAAGLTGMALSAAIKGNRYSRAEMERDLVMTFVQAATAGLGAAAGVAIKGGMPALRAVMTEAVVSEKVLEGIAEAAGRQALSKGWTLVAEMGVGAGTNAINSAAGAAMDPTNRARGESGDKAFDAGVKGLFSGAFGSLLMAPAGAAGRAIGGNYGQRALGSVVSGVGQRAFEIGYERKTGERGPIEAAEFFEEMKGVTAQSFIQSTLEHGAAAHTDARREQAAARRAPTERETPARRPPGEAERRGVPPDERRAGGRLPEEEPGGARGGRGAPAAEPTARLPPPEPIVVPAPPGLADVVGAAQKLRPPELPPVVASPTETPARPPEPPPAAAPEPVAPAAGRGRPADEDRPRTQRRLGPGEAVEAPVPPATGGKKQPPPLPKSRVLEGAEALEGGVMMLPNSTSRAEIDQIYHKTLREDPTREVAIYRNPETGEHILVFGNAEKAYIGPFPKLGEAPHAAEPPALRQEWKEILPADVGRWELQAHYHPGAAGQHELAPMWRRIPSSGEQTGDLLALQRESEAAGGQPRASVIHFRDNGRTGYTIFGHDPGSVEARFWINVENPNTGARETHVFPGMKEYEDWAATHGAHPNVDHTVAGGGGGLSAPPSSGAVADHAAGAGGPSAPPAGGASRPDEAIPRPDESLTIRHGTSEDAAKRIAKSGIDPHHSTGTADDFSRGFYTTLDEPNAAEYAVRGRRQRDMRNPRTPGDPGAIVEINVKLSELGTVVDVRPGGEHHAAWQEFLDRRPPPSPPVPRLPYWDTAREYGLNRGRIGLNEMQRGSVFEAFLREQKLTEVDAIRGPLGDKEWTGGISAQLGEQIVIRSRKLANVLNERMGYPAVPEEPLSPAARRAAAAEEPPRQGHDHPSLRDLPDPFPVEKYPEFEEPIRKFRAPATDEEKAAFRARQRAVDEEGIQNFLAARRKEGEELAAFRELPPGATPSKTDAKMAALIEKMTALTDLGVNLDQRVAEGPKLEALLQLAPEVVMHALRGDEPSRYSMAEAEADASLRRVSGEAGGPARLPPAAEGHVRALRDALAAKGLSADEIDLHAGNLRDLLKTPDQRLAEYRAAIRDGEITPDAVRRWREDAKSKAPNEKVSYQEMEATVAIEFADQLVASGGGVREHIGAAREREAWKGAAAGLDPEARAALSRQIDVESLDNYRALETKRVYPEREALKALDAADRKLTTEVLTKITGEPTDFVTLPAAWRAARRKAGVPEHVINNELNELNKILQDGKLAQKINKARKVQADLKVSSENVEEMALADPVLLQLAATHRAQFIERFVSMMRRENNKGRTLDAPAFRADVDKALRGGEGSLSTISEATATFDVAARFSRAERELIVFRSPSTTPGGRTNRPGIDIGGFEPRTPEERQQGKQVRVHAFDDKAEHGAKLDAVPALIERLVKNLKGAATQSMSEVEKHESDGFPPHPDHRAALDQMKEAAAKIEKIPRSGSEPFRQIAYAEQVADILKKNGITLHIISEYGEVIELADWIKAYGFVLWDRQSRSLPAEIAATPPLPPPGP